MYRIIIFFLIFAFNIFWGNLGQVFAQTPRINQNHNQPICNGLTVNGSTTAYLFPGDLATVTATGVNNASRVRFGMTPSTRPQCRNNPRTTDFGLQLASVDLGEGVYSGESVSISVEIPVTLGTGNYIIYANPAIIYDYDPANHPQAPWSWIYTSNPAADVDSFWCCRNPVGITDPDYCANEILLCNGNECDQTAESLGKAGIMSNTNISPNSDCRVQACLVNPNTMCQPEGSCGTIYTGDGLCSIDCGPCPTEEPTPPIATSTLTPTSIIPITITSIPTQTPAPTITPTIPPSPISCGASNSPGRYSICGYVFYDNNSNGIREYWLPAPNTENEGFPDIDMQLSSGQTVRSVFGGGLFDPAFLNRRYPQAGWYQFDNLTPGTYSITRSEDPVDGPYTETTDNPRSIVITNRDKTGIDFGLGTDLSPTPTNIPSWFQVQGGNVYSYHDIFNPIPLVVSGKKFNDNLEIIPGQILATSGITYYGNSFNILNGDRGLHAQSNAFPDAEKISFDSLFTQFNNNTANTLNSSSISKSSLTSGSGNLGNTIIYYHEGNLSLDGNWSDFTGNAIIFVNNGDLTINTNVSATSGSFLGFVVKMNIFVDGNVNNIDGFYFADRTFATGNSNIQLILNGTYIANGNNSSRAFYLQRISDSASIDQPAEIFRYRPDFAFTAPTEIRRAFRRWMEIIP